MKNYFDLVKVSDFLKEWSDYCDEKKLDKNVKDLKRALKLMPNDDVLTYIREQVASIIVKKNMFYDVDGQYNLELLNLNKTVSIESLININSKLLVDKKMSEYFVDVFNKFNKDLCVERIFLYEAFYFIHTKINLLNA